MNAREKIEDVMNEASENLWMIIRYPEPVLVLFDTSDYARSGNAYTIYVYPSVEADIETCNNLEDAGKYATHMIERLETLGYHAIHRHITARSTDVDLYVHGRTMKSKLQPFLEPGKLYLIDDFFSYKNKLQFKSRKTPHTKNNIKEGFRQVMT